ncbi:hypothetical protein GCM10010307_27530 [Streptomyces vastus]|uniref:Uncharacterized protein n=1 Tax=Streptomyces vastus TaxID=285451 RepID=A0ABP6D1L1_9ACTN
MAGLGIGQRGIHRRDRGAQPPCREHDDDEFQTVRKSHRDHIADTDSVSAENTRRGPDPFQKSVIVKLLAIIRDTGSGGIPAGPDVRQFGDVLHDFLTIESRYDEGNRPTQ